ncbi:MAG: protein translocase subunit SecD [Patescibacteria group bacterium]|nr:protein translocase subunit SecD [Patescibacteria group bacterium]
MKGFQANLIILLLILSLGVLGAFFVYPQNLGAKVLPWRLGLDVAGGTTLVYKVDLTGVSPSEYGSVMTGLQNVIERRINLYGVSEPNVSVASQNGQYELLVELPGVKDLKQAVDQIGATPVLDFRLAEANSASSTSASSSAYSYIPTGITGRYMTSASLNFDQFNRPIVDFQLNPQGAAIFQKLTSENVGKPLCIFIDGNFVFPNDPNGSCPVINEAISGGQAQISGSGITQSVAKELVSRFNAGALSAPITLINERTVSASAAADSLRNIVYAGLIGTGLVLLFMLIYYRLFGLFADLALVIYIIFSLSVFKLMPMFTMTLSGIAGFILSIGMAVDANILIFERTKEEIRKGLARGKAIEEGFRRAWPSIRDSNISTIITSLILYAFTSEFVRGFAFTLGIGVLISMFSAIFVTRAILKVFLKQ